LKLRTRGYAERLQQEGSIEAVGVLRHPGANLPDRRWRRRGDRRLPRDRRAEKEQGGDDRRGSHKVYSCDASRPRVRAWVHGRRADKHRSGCRTSSTSSSTTSWYRAFRNDCKQRRHRDPSPPAPRSVAFNAARGPPAGSPTGSPRRSASGDVRRICPLPNKRRLPQDFILVDRALPARARSAALDALRRASCCSPRGQGRARTSANPARGTAGMCWGKEGLQKPRRGVGRGVAADWPTCATCFRSTSGELA